MRRVTTRLAVAAVATTFILAAGQSARAGVIINIDQVGSDVVATGSGSIDLTDLEQPSHPYAALGFLVPAVAHIVEGPTTIGIRPIYGGATGPASFGSGTGSLASSGTGDTFGVIGGQNIVVPDGYVSGTSLSATDTYSGQTFASLGLTPGTYTYTWGTGADADSLTVQIGSPTPEPSTLVGGTLGIALALGCAWRRQRRRVAARAILTGPILENRC